MDPTNPAANPNAPKARATWVKPVAWWLGSLALVVALWSATWFVMALQVRTAIDDWTEETRAQGFGVGYHGYRIEGFPFDLAATFDRPSLAAPGGGRPVVWEGDRLRLSAKPWNWSRLHAVASGPNRFGFHDGRAMQVYGGVIEGLEATAQLADGQVDQIDLVLRNADLRADAGDGQVVVQAMQVNLAQTRAVTARLTGITLPTKLTRHWPLGPAVETLAVKATLTGDRPKRFDIQELSRWRDAGGTIDLDTLRIQYGPLDLKASGTIALDGDLQPVASLTTRWQGFFEFIDGLAGQGLIESRAALTAKLVLGVMAQASGGGESALNLPVSIKQRQLQAGPVKLLTLKPLRWPGAAQ